MKIIGIDPGLADTGIGIVEGTGRQVASYSFGTIQTDGDADLAVRLGQIFRRLQRVLIDESPDAMVVEEVFSLKTNPKSGITLAKASGVVLLAGEQAGIPVREVAVREAKQVLTGSGQASKVQLERAVRHHLNREAPIRPFHASDALSLALIGFYRHDHLPGSALGRAGS